MLYLWLIPTPFQIVRAATAIFTFIFITAMTR